MAPRCLIVLSVLAALPAAAAGLSLDAVVGKSLFERIWVSAPSSTRANDGLGPLYDAASCTSCHLQHRLGGPDTGVPPGAVVRLGNARGESDPVYGRQLQRRGIVGQLPEAAADIVWTEKDGRRIAEVALDGFRYGPLAPETRTALRRAPVLNGIGQLADVPESAILEQAQAERSRGDGIAGKPAWITLGGKTALGRFGWKATAPDLREQISQAFSLDIGLSTDAHPAPWGDCTSTEDACRAGPHGAKSGEVEVAPELVASIAAYLRSLPAAPLSEEGPGETLFGRVGCNACHATLHLADGTPVHAYTDLLLHDLGPELDDGIGEGAAAPGLWRTAPLWNVAESLKIGGLLHDGRARNVTEAIEWHGGEANAVRARFRDLSPSERAALAAYVSGL